MSGEARNVKTKGKSGGSKRRTVLEPAFHSAPKCMVVSLGCPKNTVDSEVLLAELVKHGYELTTDPSEASAIIVNTCGFIKDAVEESVSVLKELVQRKRSSGVFIAAGCLCSRAPELVMRHVPQVDACVPADKLNEIPTLLNSMLAWKRKHPLSSLSVGLDLKFRLLSTPPWYAYLKVSEGCDRSCSFCVIPLIRGKQRSRRIEELLQEASWLASKGVQEIILVAQETTRYGYDLYGEMMLPKLLRSLSNIDGIRWVRILYGFPTTVTDELIEAMATLPNVAHYIDIPLQHVHPDLLRAMNRPGDGESYMKLIEKLRNAMPDIAIRTTFIVGFPGESETHFEALLQFVKAAELDRVGAFIFSPEPETVAAKLDGQIPEDVKIERYERLMEVQSEISLKLNRRMIGKTIDVLVEGRDEIKKMWVGRSYRDAPEIDGVVYLRDGSGLKEGVFVKAMVEGAGTYDLFAKASFDSGCISERR
ncbi:MAG: hypothetical protein RUDDFDWM_000363 [Candidatus Fervidibacterota bacterium]